jgi:hypothetical protein
MSVALGEQVAQIGSQGQGRGDGDVVEDAGARLEVEKVVDHLPLGFLVGGGNAEQGGDDPGRENRPELLDIVERRLVVHLIQQLPADLADLILQPLNPPGGEGS